MLQDVLTYFLTETNEVELKHCKHLLHKDDHCKTMRLHIFEAAHEKGIERMREENKLQ